MQHRFRLACPRILVVCYYYDRPISLAVGNLIVFLLTLSLALKAETIFFVSDESDRAASFLTRLKDDS